MLTLLSQNTNDKNRDKGYMQLCERLPTWESVMVADVGDIADAIRPAGLSNQKSARMKIILNWINDTFGSLTLETIRDMSDDEAIKLLTTQKGIGVKTVAVMLAFSMDRDLCPVDTHVHRISKRLGWVPDNSSAEATFHSLRPLIHSGKASTFHMNLLKFGRTICTARKPSCNECPFREECVWIKSNST
jgi:endonuclease III